MLALFAHAVEYRKIFAARVFCSASVFDTTHTARIARRRSMQRSRPAQASRGPSGAAPAPSRWGSGRQNSAGSSRDEAGLAVRKPAARGCMRYRSMSCHTLAWTLRRGSPARSTARLNAGTRCAHSCLLIFGRGAVYHPPVIITAGRRAGRAARPGSDSGVGVLSRSVKCPRLVNPPTKAI